MRVRQNSALSGVFTDSRLARLGGAVDRPQPDLDQDVEDAVLLYGGGLVGEGCVLGALVHLHEGDRDVAGGLAGRGGAAGALGFDHGGDVGDPALHHHGPEVAGFRVGHPQFGRGEGDGTAGAEGGVEVFEGLAQAGTRLARGQHLQRLGAAVGGGGDEAVDDRQHHRVLGREVEVEGGAGDAGAFGEVVDRDLAQRPLLPQLLGGLEDRALAVVAAGAGGATATAVGGGLRFGGSRHRVQDT